MERTPAVRRLNEMADHILHGGRMDGWVEPSDDMSPEYRSRVVELMGRQGQTELSGVNTFHRMIPLCPTVQAAHAMGKVVWEELHHGKLNLECLDRLGVDPQPLYRAVLGNAAPERRYTSERQETATWHDVIAFTLLIDPAGFLFVGHTMETNYAPWARAQARILREERSHCEYAHKWFGDIAEHADSRAKLQDSLDRTMPQALGALGRPGRLSKTFARDQALGIRPVDPETQVEELYEILEPTLTKLNLKVPRVEASYHVAS